jgi:hypothetical protein
MSRSRLSDLQSPYGNSQQPSQQDGYGNYDLERNEERNEDLVAGEQYEMRDRSGRQLGLGEFLDEVCTSHRSVRV